MFKNPDAPQVGDILVKGEESVTGLAAPRRRNQPLPGAPRSQPSLRRQVDTAIGIVPPMVAFVGEVWLGVVLKAVDPAVVVEINAKEELGPVAVIAQEGFFVIGQLILARAVVILIEVVDEVVVLVPARKDLNIGTGLVDAPPVGGAVLVVVVLDELEESVLGRIVDYAPLVAEKNAGRVVFAHAKGLAIDKPRIGIFRRV